MAASIKKGDFVVVITGDEKHDPVEKRSGKVLRVDKKKNSVLIEGVRLRKVAKKRSAQNPQGGLLEKECPIHISNVMLKDRYDLRQSKSKN